MKDRDDDIDINNIKDSLHVIGKYYPDETMTVKTMEGQNIPIGKTIFQNNKKTSFLLNLFSYNHKRIQIKIFEVKLLYINP